MRADSNKPHYFKCLIKRFLIIADSIARLKEKTLPTCL